jgi:hypothetical protein
VDGMERRGTSDKLVMGNGKEICLKQRGLEVEKLKLIRVLMIEILRKSFETVSP